MSKHITVEYPHIEEKVLHTAEEMAAKGYKKMPQIAYLPVNRKQYVQVKQVARKVQEEFMDGADYEAELVAMCVAQTGLTPAAYQAKFKRAWND